MRGEIDGDPTTSQVRGCFGLTAVLAGTLQIPSSGWWLSIGPNELRRLKLTNLSANPAGPIVVFEGDLTPTGGSASPGEDE